MEEVERYENGEVALIVRKLDGMRRYWIQGGVGAIEFGPVGFDELRELLTAYWEEELDGADGVG